MNPQMALDYRAQVEEFQRKHRTGLVTLLFTDIVGSTQLKQALGDRPGVALIQQHHAMVREILGQFKEGQEIGTAGDSFFIVFVKPSDAVWFALLLQAKLRALAGQISPCVQDRIGLHIGEVVIEEREGASKPRDLYGVQVDICSRVMSLAGADQILLTRSAFDNARQVLKGQDIEGLGELSWLNHGPYVVKGWEEPLEICEVGETGLAPLQPPGDSEKARRLVTAGEELVLGWRPALEQLVPGTKWVLENKLGEGGFGEVWVGRHQTIKERRVFKFCFRADRVRTLKREVTLFRVLKERIGEHPNIVRLLEVYFDEPPYYIEMDYVEGKDLRTWSEERGGVGSVPLEVRLEIVAQVAEALQAAHEAGVIHRDVKPGNILISNPKSEIRNARWIQAKLTDFGIGQVLGEEYLTGITRAGFTQTMAGSTSSSGAGTQMYLAPELSAGKPASTRSDIYSLGVVLYQLIVGDFTRPATTDWAEEIQDPLLREDLKHCFAGNPAERFAGAGQLATSLRQLPQRQQALVERQTAIAAKEKAAYRRGLIRATSLAAAVVVVVTVLSVVALIQTRRAKQEAQRAARRELSVRQNLYAAEMLLAHQALDESNLGRATEILQKYSPEPGQRDLRGWEWRWLWKQCQSDELFTLGRHSNTVETVAFSPDSRFLASGDQRGVVKLWDVKARKQMDERRFSNLIQYLAFSPNAKFLAVIAGDSVGVYDPLSLGESSPSLEFTHSAYTAWTLAFSPDSKTLIVPGDNGTLKLWDLSTQNEISREFVNAYRHVALSPDGRTVAMGPVGGTADTVVLWDTTTKSEIGRLTGQAPGVKGRLAFSPDGKLLMCSAGRMAGGPPRRVCVWEVAGRREVTNLTAHAAWVGGIAFSPVGNVAATSSGDQTIKLWDAVNWHELVTLKGHRDEIWTLAYSADGSTLATGSKDGEVKIWSSLPRVRESSVLKLPSKSFWFQFTPGNRTSTFGFTLSPDGQNLVRLHSDETLSLWNLAELRQVSEFKMTEFRRVSFAISPQGRLLAVSGDDGSIKLLQAGSLQMITNLVGHTAPATRLVFSNGGVLLASDDQESIKVWDLLKMTAILSFPSQLSAVSRMTFAPDDSFLVAGFTDGTVSVLDLQTKKRKAHFSAHRSWVSCVAISPDGRKMATGSQDATAKLWDVATLKQTAALDRALDAYSGVTFSPDGRRVVFYASGSEVKKVKIFDCESGLLVGTLTYPSEQNQGAIAFLPDGNMLVSVTPDSIRVMHAPSFSEIEAAEKAKGRKD